MQFTHIENPKFSSEDLSTIDCDVFFVDIEGVTPFTANKHDRTEHSVAIYNALVSGVYGEVAAYVPPPEPPVATTVQQPVIDGVQTL